MLNAFVDQKIIQYGEYCVRSDVASRPAPDPAKHGLKGANLLALQNLGIATPNFMILTTELFNSVGAENIDYDKLVEQIALAFPEFPAQICLSVRSAGVETMPGMYDTKLDIHSIAELKTALQEAYASWNNPSAREYRALRNVPDTTGLALIVQKMVYGDAGEMSGSGAFYTRNLQTGRNEITGTYHLGAQGDETMTGSDRNYTILNHANAERDFGPEAVGVGFFKQFEAIKKELEEYFRWPQEVEFTVERGRLFVLQTRNAELPDFSRHKILNDMFDQGLIQIKSVTQDYLNSAPETVIYKLDAEKLRQQNPLPLMAESLAPGVVSGHLVFSVEQARKYKLSGEKVILVVQERTQEYLQALTDRKVDGLLTFYGNSSMHDARIARELGIPGVAVLNKGSIKDNMLIIRDSGANKYFPEGMICTLDGWANAQDQGRIYDRDYGEYRVPFKVIAESASANIAEVSAAVREQLGTLPHKDMQILHSVLRAMIDNAQTQADRPREILALDFAQNALHLMIKEREPELTIEQLNMRLYNLYRGFENYETGFTLPQTVQEFLTQAPEIIARIYQQYGSMKIAAVDNCDYILSQGGFPNHVAFDRELPLNFSITFANDQTDLSGVNFNLLAFVQDLNLYFHYVAYDSDRDASGRMYSPKAEDWSGNSPQNSDLHVSKISFAPDLIDQHKIRVWAQVDLPRTANFIESSFYLTVEGQPLWLKTNSFDERIVIHKTQKSAVSFYELLLDESDLAKKEYVKQLPKLLQQVDLRSSSSLVYPRAELMRMIEEACASWHLLRPELGARSADGAESNLKNVSDESLYDWQTRTLFKLIDLLFPGELTVAQEERTEDFTELGAGWVKVFKETKFTASDALKNKLADLAGLLQQNNVDLLDEVFILNEQEDLRGIRLDNLILYIYKCLTENALRLAPEALQKMYAVLSSDIEIGQEYSPVPAADWKRIIAKQPLPELEKLPAAQQAWHETEMPTYSINNGYGAQNEHSVERYFAYRQMLFNIDKMHYRSAAHYFQELFGLKTPEYREFSFCRHSQIFGHDSSVDSYYDAAALIINAEFKDKLAGILAELSRFVPQEAFYETDDLGRRTLSLVKTAQIHRQLKAQGLL